MSECEASEAQASEVPFDEGVAEKATTDDAVFEIMELILDETPSLMPDQLTRQALEAYNRVLDASKRLDAVLEPPIFKWRSFLND